MLGPGAHGRYHVNGCRHATIQRTSPQQWMKEVEQKGHGTAKSVKQSDYDIAGTIHILHKAILTHLIDFSFQMWLGIIDVNFEDF